MHSICKISTVVIVLALFTSCHHTIVVKPPVVKPPVILPGAWDKLGDFEGIPRESAFSFVLDNFAFVGGGRNNQSQAYLTDFWRYNSSTDFWSQMAEFPGAARGAAVAFTLNGKGYVGAGTSDGTTALSDFYEYSPEGTWKQVASLKGVRLGAVAFTVKNRAFVGTGYDPTSQTTYTDLWEYDQANDQWISAPDMPGLPRFNAFAMVINNMAYIGGGLNGNQLTNTFYRFNVDSINTNPWRQLNQPDTAREVVRLDTIALVCSSAFGIGNYGYLMGGYFLFGNAEAFKDNAWKYDPLLDKWTQCFSPCYNVPIAGPLRQSATAFTIGNYGYMGIGAAGPTSLDDFWLFDPNRTEPDNK